MKLIPTYHTYRCNITKEDWQLIEKVRCYNGYGHVRSVYSTVPIPESDLESAGPPPSLREHMLHRLAVLAAVYPRPLDGGPDMVYIEFQVPVDRDAPELRSQIIVELENFLSECKMFLKAVEGLTPFSGIKKKQSIRDRLS